LKGLKEKYVDLMKQQESTLLDLKASEEGLRGFDFICKTYEETVPDVNFLWHKSHLNILNIEEPIFFF